MTGWWTDPEGLFGLSLARRPDAAAYERFVPGTGWHLARASLDQVAELVGRGDRREDREG